MPTDFPTQQQTNSALRHLHAIVSLLPRIGLIILVVFFAAFIAKRLIVFILRLLDTRRLLDRNSIFLELTPPAHANKTPYANRQLFTDLHGLGGLQTIADKLLTRRMVFSVEVVGTRALGIRYIFCVPAALRGEFERAIHSFDPDVRIQEAEDYLKHRSRTEVQVVEFGLKSRYYPLAAQVSYEESDPVAFMLSTFHNLGPDETIALQLVLTPSRVHGTERISNRILHHQEHMETLGGHSQSFGGSLANGVNGALFGLTDTVSSVYHGTVGADIQSDGGIAQHYRQVAEGIKPAREMGAIEQGIAVDVTNKLNQSLYAVNIRAITIGNTQVSKANELRKSFNVYRTQYQSVVKRAAIWGGLQIRYRQYLMRHRLPNLGYGTGSILSASEVASIYHFPHSESARTGEVTRSLSKALPATVGVRRKADGGAFSVVLGRNEYHGVNVNIGLTAEERERHVYIIGGTGNGKTTMLFYSILQDIRVGNGVAVVDPHGDLAERLLRYIPEERTQDVVYMNPDDLQHPVGMNLLDLTPGLTGDDLLREKDLITEATISVLRKVFSDNDSGGHRVEYVLRNCIQTALTLENPTLFTIYDLLNDAKFRRRVVDGLEDKHLKDFWKSEMGNAGEFQRVKMSAGITAKIGRFLFSASAKRMLEQPKSTIDFDNLLASKKVLICNFSKGLLGEDTSALFGTTVLAKLQTAALRRARMLEGKRIPFYLYVDEFQNFATMGFVQMLSEARKYKLLLTMAEQSTAQQEEQRLVQIILANVGTIVCFRSGSPADEQLVLPLFMPYLEPGEIASLPAYSYYARIAAVVSQEPMSGVTVVVEDGGSGEVAERVIESSRASYTKPYESA